MFERRGHQSITTGDHRLGLWFSHEGTELRLGMINSGRRQCADPAEYGVGTDAIFYC